MRSENTVNDDFEDLDVDNEEAHIYDKMKGSSDRTRLHFRLAEGYSKHVLQTIARAIATIDILS